MGRSAREQKRKTGGLRFGLRAQMLCGLLGIFAFSVAILSWISGRQLTANREAQIARELSVIRENTEIHVRQLLILNEANNDEESFQSLAEDMVQELGNTGMDSLAVCSRDGELLAGRLERPGGNQPAEAAVWLQDGDLREAVAGNAAFTLLYEGDALTVLFSMPVSVEGKTIGIIRGGIDYSALWQQGRQMEGTILRATVLVFTAAFILIALFLSRILKRETGYSFTEYLTTYRIWRSMEYLRDCRIKVYEAAEKVGYQDTAYFSSQFKKIVGMSPSEYQSRCR